MPPHFQRHCQVTSPLVLTQIQQDDLRRINLAQIYGYQKLAQAMLAEFFTAHPTLKSLYLRDYPQGEK